MAGLRPLEQLGGNSHAFSAHTIDGVTTRLANSRFERASWRSPLNR
jgi:hypothetical protein